MEKEPIKEGHMYRVIEGEVVEVVRHGDELLPVTDPITREIVGQQVLMLWEDKDGKTEADSKTS